MQTIEEVSPQSLKKYAGHEVEALAFGISYRGTLETIDPQAGTITIRDTLQKEDYVVLEIERVENFKVLRSSPTFPTSLS